ncbi:MAG TPA: SDR family oxidoreductase [Pseudonocardiaceae bacterium]|jgi:2-hydroxycyclohexanecarboxyl-CoA dehydrogenase
MRRFEDRSAVVTGGASGIGAATVRRLAAEGARVAVLDIDEQGAADVAAEVDGLAVPVDVTDHEQVRRAILGAEDGLGRIDVLVTNAGSDRPGFFVNSTPGDWQEVLAVNLLGVMSCVHAALPGMRRRNKGSVVIMASEAGRVGTSAGAAYSAAKAGAIGFMKAIAREWARFGVRCNAVAPGPIDTPLLRGLEESGKLGATMRQAMINATALGRTGTPAEVAASIAFLASDDASYLTGHTIAVSGGLSMW